MTLLLPGIEEELAAFVEANPGATVALTREGKVAFEHCGGYANREHRVPVSHDTGFALSSVTK